MSGIAAIFVILAIGFVIGGAFTHAISSSHDKPEPPPIDPFPRSTWKTTDEKRICK